MKFLIINGPNINMLGIREPGIYGKENYEALLELCRKTGEDYGIEIECFQSNHEGAIVDKIQQAYGVMDGIVINPAAYTHTSIAILDALKSGTNSMCGSTHFQSGRKRSVPADFLCGAGVFPYDYRTGNRRLPDGD
mgnify:CR=1 FL=1